MRSLLAGLLLTTLTVAPSPGTDVTQLAEPASPVAVVALPGGDRRFASYDFRQSDFGDVDWPVAFVFRGNVDVDAVKDGLCRGSGHAWKYCDTGGPMYLYTGPLVADVDATRFVADRGVKRFNENCSTTHFSAHIRLYPVAGSDDPRGAAPRVVGTVHLDFGDKGGCTGRIHGYPDVAKQWFLTAMRSVPGWQVTPDAWNLHNGSAPYVVQRKVAGVEVPHVYGQSGLAADVYLPGAPALRR